jgi:hypothetical protein
MNVSHLEQPAQRLLVAADMLAEMIQSGQGDRAAYLAASLKGDAEAFLDLVGMVIRAKA